MINEKSLKSHKESPFSPNSRVPLYDSYCFSQIPATVERLLMGREGGLPLDCIDGEFDHVYLLFLDGFGWKFFEKFSLCKGDPLVSKLTSMFPSTTGAHIPTIHMGLTPAESGFYEWFSYEPKVGRVIAPLPFMFAGDNKPDSLPLEPKELYPFETVYERLEGITCRTIQPKGIVESKTSQVLTKGADSFGYQRLDEAFVELKKPGGERSYTFFYYGDIDSTGHRKGIDSPEFYEAAERVFVHIEEFMNHLPSRSCVLITADHGMTPVDPKTTFYLNRKIPNVEKFFEYDQEGNPKAPAGSCRDFFAHIQEDRLDECKEVLHEFLKNKADIHFTSELIDAGYFGKELSERFMSRVGNLVILPRIGESVFWWEKGRFQQNFYGAHGGLSTDEMEIPLIVYRH